MIDLKWDFSKFDRNINRIKRESHPIGLQAMRRATEYVRGYIVKNKLKGQVLNWKKGRLAGSISSAQRIEGQDVVGMVGSNLKYARIHELGGEIRPKKAKALFIPLRANVLPRQAGLVYGKDFIFSQLVKIPKRPYIMPSIEESSSKIANIFGSEFFMEIKSKVAG